MKILKEELYNNNSTLNPILWENNKLKPQVREKILDLVDAFQNTLDIPLKILDINIVGSNASYNYNNNSDVDIHIITNFEQYGYPEELVQAAMQSFKTNFNNKLNVKYGGFNVELYIEDVNSSPQSNGIYSVMEDKWIKEPKKLEPIEVDLEPEYSQCTKQINELLNDNNTQSEDITEFIDRIYVLRRNSLLKDGEFGKGNLIFKKLRNEELLDKLKEKKNELLSKELSI